MLRIIHTNNALPFSVIVDPNATFQGGMIAQLKLYGNQVVAGVSDGRAPFGIIDDVKSTIFSTNVIDEVKTVLVPSATQTGGRYFSTYDVMVTLDNAAIFPNSFVSSIPCVLNAVNGVITFPSGTELNYSSTTSGIPDSIRAVVRYSYQIPYVVGEDSTAGSGRVTIWTTNVIVATDQYDSTAQYAVNAILFSGLDGKVTTQQIDETYPAVGMVTAPPTAGFGWLEFKSFF